MGFVLLHFLSKKRKFTGQIAACYLVWYGFGRFFIEYFRTDSLYLGQIKVSMLLSGLMVAAGLIILVIGFKKSKGNSVSMKYAPVFDEVEQVSSKPQTEEE